MANKARIRQYFAEGLTSRGYISLLPNMAERWRRVFVLLGGPGTGKSTMINAIGTSVADQGHDIDFIRSAKEPESTVGLVIPDRAIAVIDAHEVSPLRWKAPGIVETFVDLTDSPDARSCQKREEILSVQEQLSKLQIVLEDELAELFGEPVKEICYDLQGSGGTWMTHSTAKMNWGREKSGPWSKAQAALDKIQRSVVTPCFLHGLSIDGWINLAPSFLNGYDQIQLEGDETAEALNWVLQEAQCLGQIIEIVLHPLRPDEVIGVIFPERQLALWLGNAENLAHQGLGQPFSQRLIEVLTELKNQRETLKGLYREFTDPCWDKHFERLQTMIFNELE